MIQIREATAKGYTELIEGGAADLYYPSSKTRRGRVIDYGRICPTIPASAMEIYVIDVALNDELKVMQIGNCMPGKNRDNPNQGRVYDRKGLCPTLSCMGGGNREPMIIEPINLADGGTSRTIKAQYQKNSLSNFTRKNAFGATGVVSYEDNPIRNLRIRKLTPKECWRLMGFDDESFSRAEKTNSNAQLYRQAGNSIVVNCIMEILKEMM